MVLSTTIYSTLYKGHDQSPAFLAAHGRDPGQIEFYTMGIQSCRSQLGLAFGPRLSHTWHTTLVEQDPRSTGILGAVPKLIG